ncbi:MAG: hypothetical protein QOC94_4906 [Actinoplanes sp.]|nr:hypothetical protein [Actinoplanes sp.]
MEPLHDRIAKRRAEIAEQQAALDRKDAQGRAADNDTEAAMVDPHRSGGVLRSTVFLILIIVVAAGLFGLAVTLSRLAGEDFGDGQRQGKAQVISCVRHGPISTMGFGYWDACTASITLDDGATDRITVSAVLKSSDIGTDVQVGDVGNYHTTKEIVRADSTHRPWLRWIGYAIGAIALMPTLVATLTVRELLRFRRRR